MPPSLKAATQAGEDLSYGPLVVLKVDLARQHVFIGTDPAKSHSQIEELESQDACTLAQKAAQAAGMTNPQISRNAVVVPYDLKTREQVKMSLDATPSATVVSAALIELTTMDGGSDFDGDSLADEY